MIFGGKWGESEWNGNEKTREWTENAKAAILSCTTSELRQFLTLWYLTCSSRYSSTFSLWSLNETCYWYMELGANLMIGIGSLVLTKSVHKPNKLNFITSYKFVWICAKIGLIATLLLKVPLPCILPLFHHLLHLSAYVPSYNWAGLPSMVAWHFILVSTFLRKTWIAFLTK